MKRLGRSPMGPLRISRTLPDHQLIVPRATSNFEPTTTWTQLVYPPYKLGSLPVYSTPCLWNRFRSGGYIVASTFPSTDPMMSLPFIVWSSLVSSIPLLMTVQTGACPKPPCWRLWRAVSKFQAASSRRAFPCLSGIKHCHCVQCTYSEFLYTL